MVTNTSEVIYYESIKLEHLEFLRACGIVALILVIIAMVIIGVILKRIPSIPVPKEVEENKSFKIVDKDE